MAFSRRQFLGFSASGMLTAGAGLGPYAFYVEPRLRLKLAQYEVRTARWPKTMAPLRIAIVTDIHANEPFMPAERIAEIAAETNRLAPVVPLAYGQRFAYGHIVEDGRHLVVSAGIGCSVLPVRFLVPPEITLVSLGGA